MGKWLWVIVVFSLLLSCSPQMAAPPAPAPVAQPTQTAETQQLQSKRLDLINGLIDKGVFSKVEMPGDLPHVWVTPLFNSLNFDDKQSFIGVVYAYYHTLDPKIELVTLYDNKTGKTVGRYAAVYGGLKMD